MQNNLKKYNTAHPSPLPISPFVNPNFKARSWTTRLWLGPLVQRLKAHSWCSWAARQPGGGGSIRLHRLYILKGIPAKESESESCPCCSHRRPRETFRATAEGGADQVARSIEPLRREERAGGAVQAARLWQHTTGGGRHNADKTNPTLKFCPCSEPCCCCCCSRQPVRLERRRDLRQR